MPKLKNRPPKYSKLKQYAVVYFQGKIHYLGLYGSNESWTAYNRFIAESRGNPVFIPPPEGESATVADLVAAFLEYAEPTLDSSTYGHYRTLIGDFVLKLYGNDTAADAFKPRCLKLLRSEMVESKRFSRNTINKYIRFVVALFHWGVSEELVQPNTHLALKAVKPLKKGSPGTFETSPREPVPDAVIAATLPFLPPVVAAMVQVQRLTAMRPSEVFRMTVGSIDQSRGNGLWYYSPKHKTEEHIGQKPIPLGKPEQELIAPYLEGKTAEQAVFSPRQAVRERAEQARARRKTKVTPSQQKRDRHRAENPPDRQVGEFYDRDSYRRAITYAIKKGNQHGVKIKHWSPYLLRNSGATAIELEHGLDEAQAQLGHTTADMTKRYSAAQLKQREKLALSRVNPFATDKGEDTNDENEVS